MRVALWGAFDAPDGELLASRRVLDEGLRRRLPGCEVTALSARGTRLAVDGGRPAAMLPGPEELAGRFDCVVDTGTAGTLETSLPVLDGAPEEGSLALLLPGLLDPGLLRRRAELLRLLGWAWPAGRVLTVEGDATLLGAVEAIAAALRSPVDDGAVVVQLAASGGSRGEGEFAAALDAELGGRCRRVPEVTAVEDLVALIVDSTAYAGPPGLGLWAATALGVPVAAPAQLAGGALPCLLAGEAVPAPAEAAMAALERHLDELAARVAEAGGGGGPAPGPGSLTPEDRLEALRTAHQARGLQLLAERRAAQAALDGALAGARAEVDRLRSELSAARAANDAIVASRTWRYTQPVRDTLARVRERRR